MTFEKELKGSMKQLRNCVLIAVLVALAAQLTRADIQQHVAFARMLGTVALLTTAAWFAGAAFSRWKDARVLCQYVGSANLGMAIGVYVALNAFR